MDDGNVVLEAEDTQFKVHRSVLCRHSPVFRDMFTMPHVGGEGDSVVEGCPVVRLQDSAQDLKYLLLALYGEP